VPVKRLTKVKRPEREPSKVRPLLLCTYEKCGEEHGHVDVARVVGDEHERRLAQQDRDGLDVFVDLDLALKVRNGALATGNLLVVRQAAPDVVLERIGLCCSLGTVDALSRLDLNCLFHTVSGKGGEEVGDSEDDMGSLRSSAHLLSVMEAYRHTWKACSRDFTSLTSAATISTPLADKPLAASLFTLRVTPRTL